MPLLNRDHLMSDQYHKMVKEAEKSGLKLRSEEAYQTSFDETLSHIPRGENLYVFAYGSLMWNPVISFKKKIRATLKNYHRSFCIHLPAFRATVEKPGLMMALEKQPGATCEGMLYFIEPDLAQKELALLWLREMMTTAYMPAWVNVQGEDHTYRALTFVVDSKGERYLKILDPNEQAKRIAQAEGPVGSNRDYLFETVKHLQDLGCCDQDLEQLASLVRGYCCFF